MNTQEYKEKTKWEGSKSKENKDKKGKAASQQQLSLLCWLLLAGCCWLYYFCLVWGKPGVTLSGPSLYYYLPGVECSRFFKACPPHQLFIIMPPGVIRLE